MSKAAEIVASAGHLGDILFAAKHACVTSSSVDRNERTVVTYSFADRSNIRIEDFTDGPAVTIGQYELVTRDVVDAEHRRCREPECSECHGSGIGRKELPCVHNSEVPF